MRCADNAGFQQMPTIIRLLHTVETVRIHCHRYSQSTSTNEWRPKVYCSGDQFLCLDDQSHTSKNTTAPHVATDVLENRLILYCKPYILSTDDGKTFKSKTLAADCTSIGTPKVFRTKYHWQSSGQVLQYSHTQFEHMQHGIDEHQEARVALFLVLAKCTCA